MVVGVKKTSEKSVDIQYKNRRYFTNQHNENYWMWIIWDHFDLKIILYERFHIL